MLRTRRCALPLLVAALLMAVFTSSGSPAAAGAKGLPTSCYLNFKWGKKKLTYSYLGQHRYLGDAAQAVKNWNAAGIGIQIVPAPAGRTGDINFVDRSERSKVLGAAWPADPRFASRWPSARIQRDPIPIYLNRYGMDSVDMDDPKHPDRKRRDFLRTYVTTHELGHALGLQHPEACGIRGGISSVEAEGNQFFFSHPPSFNTPQAYDVAEGRALYR